VHQYASAGIPTDEVSLHRDISVSPEGFLRPCVQAIFPQQDDHAEVDVRISMQACGKC